MFDDGRRVEKEVMSAMEEKRTEAKEPRETDAAGVDVTWKAASGAKSSKAEIGPLWRPGLASARRARWRIHAP